MEANSDGGDVDTTSSTSNGDEKIMWSPALTKLFSCCAGMAQDSSPKQNILVTVCKSDDEATLDTQSSDFDEAVTNLLRITPPPPSCCEKVGELAFTPMQHIRQSGTWDCGIACLQMVLRWLRQHDSNIHKMSSALSPAEVIERKILLNKAGTKSIWTVDLVMLLENLLSSMDDQETCGDDDDNSSCNRASMQPNHDNTTYLFCSEVMGVSASHSTTGYYVAGFSADSARVTKICGEIVRLRLPILCPFHLEFQQFIELISYQHCIAIVLVDNTILMKQRGQDCPPGNGITATTNDSQGQRLIDKNTTNCRNDSYMGHYVIVCGISRDADHLVAAYSSAEIEMITQEPNNNDPYCLVVVNPGISSPTTMFINPKKFEQAWRAKGTDCDVIFIAKHQF